MGEYEGRHEGETGMETETGKIADFVGKGMKDVCDE